MGFNRDYRINFTYCICEGTYFNESDRRAPLICKSCEKASHRSCTCYEGPDSEFECSLCRVQRLDPFNSVFKFLWYGRVGNSRTAFKVTIDYLEKWTSTNKDVYVVSLPLHKTKLMHEWPKTFELKINNEIVHIVREPNCDHPRRDNPIKVTYAMRSGDNIVELYTTTYGETGPLFFLVFMVSKRVTIERMVETIKKKRTIPLRLCKERIIDLVNNLNDEDDDDVICMEETNEIELNCPITLDRMELPARGRKCRHLQCFDLKGYLHVMQNTAVFNTRWKCPECELILKPIDLVIDGYVLNIIKNTSKDVSTVKIDREANYEVVKRETMWDSDDSYSDSLVPTDTRATAQSGSGPSVYDTSVKFEEKTAPCPNNYGGQGIYIGGVYIKREQQLVTRGGDAMDVEPVGGEIVIPMGFRKGEVISLDSSDDEDMSTPAPQPKPLNDPLKTNKIPNVQDNSGGNDQNRQLKPMDLTIEKGGQGNTRPSTTLLMRLQQLPRMS
ncbi:zinc finger miz domain-containing protein [Babesia gibsoni]|uniref:Zinc finger miz domain-containing protein n=1 Tax=Babesia gibsoni TaxID=33632 RepID=A0AAD8PDZ3_BABGI|nr:zinc finger miz domain-containing protein [Babesia gibsoni]